MVGILPLLICALFARTSNGYPESANYLIERILREGNHGLPIETYLPETFFEVFQFKHAVNVTVRGARVVRGYPKVVRTRDAVVSVNSQGKKVLKAYLSTGTVWVYLDDVHIVTPWRTFESEAQLTYEGGEFTVLAEMDVAADCKAHLAVVDLVNPKLSLTSKGFFGKLLDLLVGCLQGTYVMRQGILRFYSPVIVKTIVEPFQNAAMHNLCNSTGRIY